MAMCLKYLKLSGYILIPIETCNKTYTIISDFYFIKIYI